MKEIAQLREDLDDVGRHAVEYSSALGHHDDRLTELAAQQKDMEKDMRRVEVHDEMIHGLKDSLVDGRHRMDAQDRKFISVSDALAKVRADRVHEYHRIDHVEDKVGRLEHKTKVHDGVLALQQEAQERTANAGLIAGVAGVSLASLGTLGALLFALKNNREARRREKQLREELQRSRQPNSQTNAGANGNQSVKSNAEGQEDRSGRVRRGRQRRRTTRPRSFNSEWQKENVVDMF